MSLYICFHLHNVVSCSNMQECILSHFYMLLSVAVPFLYCNFIYLVSEKYIYIHIYVYISTCICVCTCTYKHVLQSASMIRRKSIITIFLKNKRLKRELFCTFIYIYNPLSLRRMLLMLFIYHAQSFPYFLEEYYAFFSYFGKDLQAILKNDSSVL